MSRSTSPIRIVRQLATFFLVLTAAITANAQCGAPGINPSTITFNTTSGTSTLGQLVQFSVTVKDTSGIVGSSPSSLVAFSYDGTPFPGGPVPLTPTGDNINSIAVANITTLPVGTHTISATYEGDATFTCSTTGDSLNGDGPTITQTVTMGASSTVLGAPTPSTLGAAVTFTATVSDASGDSGFSPTGTVTFMDGAVAIGSGALSSVGPTMSQATFTTSVLATGSHSNITATYAGDTNFGGSSSAAVAQIVNARTTNTSIQTTGSVNVGTASPVAVSVADQQASLTPSTPGTSAIVVGATLNHARWNAAAALLQSGKVLIAGGIDGVANTSAELYDPISKTFSNSACTLSVGRVYASATTLPNGKVLIAGGSTDGTFAHAQASADIYNPATDSCTASAGSMTAALQGHTATLLANGTVLIAGGETTTGPPSLTSTEIYTPGTDSFAAGTVSLVQPRAMFTATMLPSGLILYAGGDVAGDAELLDPVSGSVATGSMVAARSLHNAALMPDGLVMISGGQVGGATAVNGIEIYDPIAGTFNAAVTNGTTASGNVTSGTDNRYLTDQRTGATATLLNDGTVLVVGGKDNTPTILGSAEAYIPSYDPRGEISLSTDNGNGMLTIRHDTLTGCSLAITGTGVSACGASVTPGHVNGGTHNINAQFAFADWTASFNYTQNFLILPLTGNAGGFIFEATTPGTSSGTEPTWPQSILAGSDQTPPDGAVTWTNVGLPNHSASASNTSTPASTEALTVNTLGITLTAVTDTKTYNATTSSTQLPTATFTTGGAPATLLSGDTASQSFDNAHVSPPNTLTANAVILNGLTPVTADYTLATPAASATGIITPAPLTITATSGLSKVYGQADPPFTFATVGLQGSDTAATVLTGALARTAGESVAASPYTITIGTLAPNADYTINTYNGATFAITPATLTITANAGQTKVYGQADPTFTYASSGFQFTDTAATVLTGALGRAAGETVAGSPYAINQGTLAANSNYTISFASANFSITPATLTITVNAGQHKVYGQADPAFTFASSGFQFTDTAATVLTGALSRAAGETVAGGPYAINQGSLAANTNYTISYTGSTFAITPAPLSITANAGQTKVYGQVDPAFTFASSGFQFTDTAGTVLTGALARAAGETVAGGPYALNQGTLAANTNYTINFTGANFTITPATLTINATSGLHKVYGQADPAGFPFSSSGFQFTDTAATVLTGTLSRAAGESVAGSPYAILQGSLTANSNYTISYTGSTFAITPAPLTITANAGQTKVYGQADPVFTFASSGFQFTDTAATVLTGALARAAGENVPGPYAINQGTLVSNGNYTISFTGANFNITPATLTVTAVAKTKVYGQADPALTFNSSGFQFTDTAATVLTGGLTRAAGESVAGSPYAISQGTLVANSNYTISFTGANFTITPATLTITANAGQTKVYGQADPVFTFASSGFQFTDTAATVLTGALSRAAGENVTGSPYPITQGSLAANTNYTISFTSAGFNITPAPLSISANAGQTKVYGQADPAFTFTPSGFQFSDTAATVLTGALARAAGQNVGNYAINQGTLVSNANYTLSFTGANFSITKAALTVSAVANTRVYDATNLAAAVPTVSGLQFTDTVTGLAETYDTKNVGAGKTMSVSAFTVNDGNGGNNYSVSTPTSATGVITQKSLNETGLSVAASKVYDSTTNATVSGIPSFQVENVGTGSSGDGKAYLGDSVNLSGAPTGTYNSANVVGANSVTFGGLSLSGADAPNYALVLQPNAAATITAASLHVNAVANSKTYGAADPALNFSASGFQGADTQASVLSGAIARVAGETVAGSPYAINQGTLASNTNYSITYTGANFVINQATLSVAAVANTKVYGSSDPALTFNATGFQFTDTQASVMTGSLARVAGETVAGSPYAINQGSVAANTNYTISYTGATFTITPAALNVTAVANSKVYGGTDPALTFSASGFQFTDSAATVLTGNVARAAGETVGAYAIGQGTLVANANYALSYNAANFTVTPAPLTVTPANQSRPYGGQNPVLTGVVTGLQLGDQITGQYITTATAAANVGSYPITVMGLNDPNGRASNYTITNQSGQLSVAPANTQVGSVTISAVANSSETPQFTMSASVSNSSVANAGGNAPGGNLIFQDCVGSACTQIAKVALSGGSATTGTITLASNASPHAIKVTYDQGDANYAAPATTSGNGAGVAVLSSLSTTAGAAIPAQTVPILNPTGSSGPASYTNISCAITSGGFPVANTICTVSPTAINNLAVGTTFSVQVSLATKGASAQPAGTQARLHLRGLESLSLVFPAVLILPLGMSAETRRKLLRRRTLTWLGIGMLLAMMLMASSCGGGGFGNPNSLLPNQGQGSATPVGNYIVQVTGTNQSGQSVVMANIPMTVGF